jgi:hypothetical protein
VDLVNPLEYCYKEMLKYQAEVTRTFHQMNQDAEKYLGNSKMLVEKIVSKKI